MHTQTYTQPQPTSSAFLSKLRLHQFHLGKETLELSVPLFCSPCELHVHTADGAEHQDCNDDDNYCRHRGSEDNDVEVVLQPSHGLIQVTTDEHLHTEKGNNGSLSECFHFAQGGKQVPERNQRSLHHATVQHSLHSTHHIQNSMEIHVCFPL